MIRKRHSHFEIANDKLKGSDKDIVSLFCISLNGSTWKTKMFEFH